MSTDLKDQLDPLGIIWGAAGIAAALGIKRRQAQYLIESGKLKGVVRIGSRIAITREALAANFKSLLEASDGE